MFDKPFLLKIITPTGVVYQDKAVSVSAPGACGGFQVLYNHAPLLSALEIGEVKVRNEAGGEIRYATSGGFLEVKNNEVVLLTDAIEPASEIDTGRAMLAKERAERRLQSKDPAVDHERAQAALLRALNRLRVHGRP
jgi:F-type H+-transporting ATPase subunit epsilon